MEINEEPHWYAFGNVKFTPPYRLINNVVEVPEGFDDAFKTAIDNNTARGYTIEILEEVERRLKEPLYSAFVSHYGFSEEKPRFGGGQKFSERAIAELREDQDFKSFLCDVVEDILAEQE